MLAQDAQVDVARFERERTLLSELDHPGIVAYVAQSRPGHREAPWLDELTDALSEIDRTADFMQRAIHFLVPAGDDVVEVAAWRVQVEAAGATATWWPDDPS